MRLECWTIPSEGIQALLPICFYCKLSLGSIIVRLQVQKRCNRVIWHLDRLSLQTCCSCLKRRNSESECASNSIFGKIADAVML